MPGWQFEGGRQHWRGWQCVDERLSWPVDQLELHSVCNFFRSWPVTLHENNCLPESRSQSGESQRSPDSDKPLTLRGLWRPPGSSWSWWGALPWQPWPCAGGVDHKKYSHFLDEPFTLNFSRHQILLTFWCLLLLLKHLPFLWLPPFHKLPSISVNWE